MAYTGKLLKDMKPAERVKRVAALRKAGKIGAVPAKYRPKATKTAKPAKPTSPVESVKAALAAAANAPITPGSSITNQMLGQQTDAAVNLQYGQTDQQLAQNAQAQSAATNRNQDWYRQYQDDVNAAQSRQSQGQQALASQLQGMNQSGQDASLQSTQAIQGQMQADAASRGATVDPSVAGNAVQAASVRRALQDSFGAQLIGAAANQAAFTNSQGLVARQQGGERLQADQGQERKIRSDQATVAGQKGSYRTKFQADTIAGEAKAIQDAQLTAAATGQKNDATNLAANKAELAFVGQHGVSSADYLAMSPEQRAQNDGHFKKTVSPPKPSRPTPDSPFKYGYTKKEWLALPLAERTKIDAAHAPKGKGKGAGKAPKPTSGPGSTTPVQERATISQIRVVAGILQQPQTKSNGRVLTSTEVRQQLLSGHNPLGKPIDPEVLGAAQSLADNGGRGIGKNGVKHLHALGIHVGGNFKVLSGPPVKRPGPPKFPRV